MRVSTSIILAFFGALASVHASADVADVKDVGTLPAFLKYQSEYLSGDHSPKVMDQLKSLAVNLDSQGTDLGKIMGNDVQGQNLLDILDSHLSLVASGKPQEKLLNARGEQDDEDAEDCDDEVKMALPGKVEQFISLNKKLSAKDASKDANYKKDLKKLHSLGRQLKKGGSKVNKVVGSTKFGKAVTKMVDSQSDDATVEALEKVVKEAESPESSSTTEKRDSGIAAPGQVEQFIALFQKVSQKDASSSPTYEADLKKFQKLGKQLKKEGTKLAKVVGNSHTAVALEKLITDLGSDVQDLGAMLVQLLGDLLKRDDAASSGIAAPGKVEQFIALSNKLSKPDASKSPADLEKFQKLGKQLKKEKVQTDKILGTTSTGKALEKLTNDAEADGAKLGSMLTELVSDVLKREEEASSGIAAPGKVEQFIALTNKLAGAKKIDEADAQKFQQLGKDLKKNGGAASTDKALGTSHFASAAKKVISESSASNNVASVLTNAVEDLIKRDGLADLVEQDILPTLQDIRSLGDALMHPDAQSSPHYAQALKQLKKAGLAAKKDGKDPKSMLGSGDKAQALAEMFDQAGDKTSDVRDESIPVLSGRNFHGDAHSHAAMARRRAHAHGLEN